MTHAAGAPGTLTWRALLGERPNTRALRRGQLSVPELHLEFADVAVPNKAFKRVVRDVEFDVAELALMTFLMARSRDVPLVLLPIVVCSRDPLQYLVCNVERGRLSPGDLTGKRVGVRSYTTTTAVWIRGLLANDFGVDVDQVAWVTLEEAHVADFTDPPNVRRAPDGNLAAMLIEGEIDAAIVDPVPADPRVAPVIPDHERTMRDWQRRHGAVAINHMIVVREALTRSHPDAVREVFRLFQESRAAADPPVDPHSIPMGLETNRRSLQMAIGYAAQQHLLRRPLAVDDLFNDVTAALA